MTQKTLAGVFGACHVPADSPSMQGLFTTGASSTSNFRPLALRLPRSSPPLSISGEREAVGCPSPFPPPVAPSNDLDERPIRERRVSYQIPKPFLLPLCCEVSFRGHPWASGGRASALLVNGNFVSLRLRRRIARIPFVFCLFGHHMEGRPFGTLPLIFFPLPESFESRSQVGDL